MWNNKKRKKEEDEKASVEKRLDGDGDDFFVGELRAPRRKEARDSRVDSAAKVAVGKDSGRAL